MMFSLHCKPFIFVRHGETPLNRDHLIGGRTDVPLTAAGEQQAEKARGILAQQRFSCVAVSPLLRARQTAAIALPGHALQIVDDLRERDWGDLECQPYAQQPPYEETPPGGERWIDFTQRVVSALNTLLSEYDTPLVVAHSGVYRVIQLLATGSPYGPRVGNVAPLFILPATVSGQWQFSLLEQ